MNNKIFLVLSLTMLLGIHGHSQELEPASNAGVDAGFLVFMGKQNAPEMMGFYKSFTTAYFGDLRNGIRTGLIHSTDLENCNNALLVPIYFARRNKPTINKEPIIVETFGDFIFGIISAIVPSRVEYNIGPTIGYFQSSKTPLYEDEYRVRRNMLFAINAGVRPSFQIWRFNLGFNLNVGYVPTKNFRYYSPNTYENGTTSNWMVNFGGYLTYSFDI